MKKYLPVTPLNYSFVFDFESNYDYRVSRAWVDKNFVVAVYACVIYVGLIFSIQHFMKKRSRFELRGLLITWNVFLAVFSFIGASRTLPEFITILTYDGLQHSFCVPSYIYQDKVASFWSCLFVLSKLIELGDTFFIVLRKQPLIFLHWFHHITVLLYTWMTFPEPTGYERWYVVMNYCAHTLMYSYYALKAMKFKLPMKLSMSITALQITQMVIGCMVNWKVYQLYKNNVQCHLNPFHFKCGIAIYATNFILFANFFYQSYVDKNKKTKNA